jgi:hypothetical protein
MARFAHMADIVVRRAPAALGVTVTGVRVVELAPEATRVPATRTGEEVYLVVRGGGRLTCGGLDVALGPDVVVRAGAACRIVAGPDGLLLLSIRD